MPSETGQVVTVSVDVPLDPQAAFELYTSGIMRWWRLDSPYWNDHRRRRALRFEPGVGGRFIEVYDETSGEGFEIGRISAWEPGRRIAYTWRQADWAPEALTRVEVIFEPVDAGTRVLVRHRGWETLAGGDETAAGYGSGLRELLGWYGEAAASDA